LLRLRAGPDSYKIAVAGASSRHSAYPDHQEIVTRMANEKNSSDTSSSGKTAKKKSPAKKAASSQPVAAKGAVAAAVPVPAPSAPANHRAQPSAAALYDEIRRRAYEFYCERGGHHGSHEADWHRAEMEVRSKYK
jgi:Protein of unknown function (DUF2934)